ncbi:MAG: hypothetical protein LUQ41_02185 [Methanomicrobiales archaeon]|nr:hypothetical protein [Methanomicrobiales archaeon]
MKHSVQNCLKKGTLVKVPVEPDRVRQEIRDVGTDLSDGERLMGDGDERQGVRRVQHALLHGLRGLILSKGYSEKNEDCLECAVEELFVRPGIIGPEVLNAFSESRRMGENAVHGQYPDHERLMEVFRITEEFREALPGLLKV